MINSVGGPRAEHRRRALRRFLEAHETNPRELCLRAGLASANALYNFLSGRSGSLNTSTYEALVQAVPGASMADILGEKKMSSGSRISTVTVKGEVRSGVWLDSVDYPHYDQFETAMPIPTSVGRGLYALRVRGDGMDQIYPDGSILVVQGLHSFLGHVGPGVRVVVHRHRGGLTEATVKEVTVLDDERPALVSRTNNPRHALVIELDEGWDVGSTTQTGGVVTEVVAVVLGCFMPEVAIDAPTK